MGNDDDLLDDIAIPAAIDAYESSCAGRVARNATGCFVELGFWEKSIRPTRHALERFAERAAPPATDDSYLRWALRDLAIAEGRISDAPPAWSRLAHSARLYLVIGRFLCLPLKPHRWQAGAFEPTTAVIEYTDVGWKEALELGCVRLPPPPPRPPDDQAYAAGRGALHRQAAAFTEPDPPRPRGLPLTPARRQARAAWRDQRDKHRADLERRRADWLNYHLAELARNHTHARDRLARWQRELVPSYHRAWQTAYAQARAGYGWSDPAQARRALEAAPTGARRGYLPIQPPGSTVRYG